MLHKRPSRKTQASPAPLLRSGLYTAPPNSPSCVDEQSPASLPYLKKQRLERQQVQAHCLTRSVRSGQICVPALQPRDISASAAVHREFRHATFLGRASAKE